MKIVLQLYVLFALVLADDLSLENSFNGFIKQFRRQYSDESEKNYRFLQFKENMKIIEEHNSRQNSYVLGITPFTDLSNEEFASRFVLNNAIMEKVKEVVPPTEFPTLSTMDLQGIPHGVDWARQNKVTSVKNQKACGSCWAFSAVGAIESAIAIQGGELEDLSVQYLVDCDYSDAGCQGGLMSNAYEFVMEDGLPLWEDYPYIARQGSCKKVPPKVSILGYYDVPTGSSYELMKALTKNPVSVAIQADSAVFQNYKSGVLSDESCGHNLNHGVLTVGYELDTSHPYFRVKNSWGPSWGEDGYIRLAITDSYYGTCGIHLLPSYPFVDL